jgi:SSS family transporter
MTLFAAGDPGMVKALHGPDYVMLGGYFVLMLGIGAYFYRFMRGMKVYFTGGNKIPWWLAGVSFYMSSFSAYAFVIYSGLCFRYGWVGVTAFWVTVPATLFSVLFFATRWRRARIDSPVEFLENRYNALVRQLFVWFGVPVGIVDDSLKLIATGTFIHVGMGFSIESSIIACGVIMVLYTFMGGLWAVTVTDFVQFVILAVAVVVVFPLSISRVGGFEGLVKNSPAGFFRMTNDEYDWLYIVLLIGLYAIAYSSTHWHLIQKYFCVPAEKDAKKVGWLVMVLNIVGPPLMFTPAIAARQFLPQGIEDKEVYPLLCAALLPVGMLGLIIAAMFSATMANLSSHFNVRASVLTNDVYRRLLHPRATEKELVVAGRGMTVLVGALSIILAYMLAGRSAPELFKIMVTLFAVAVGPLGLPMLLGITSKRVNSESVVVALLGGLAIGLTLIIKLPPSGVFCGVHWESETLIFAITTLATLAMMFGISAITGMSPAQQERVALFRRRLATPVGELPEEKAEQAAVKPHEEIMSPFRVVGVCVLLIGLLMACIQPWLMASTSGLATWLNLGMAIVLVAIGGLMAWCSRKPAGAAPAADREPHSTLAESAAPSAEDRPA